MKFAKHLLALSVVTILIVCKEPDILDKSIEQAQHISDPYEAAELLTNAEKDYYEHLSNFAVIKTLMFNNWKETMAEKDRFKAITGNYLVKAVERGDERAMTRIFESGMPDETLEKSAPFIMKYAEKSDASAEALLAAARLTEDGRYVQQDFQRSFSFLIRSWKLSQNPHTALQAREIFQRMQDGPNAYLWNLRSLNASRWPGAWFESERSPQEKVDIQRMAQDPNVLVIGNSPLKPIND